MVLEFLRGGAGHGFEHIVAKSVSMLGDARHSFDLATLALLTDTKAEDVADDIHATDERINNTEHQLRSELVVHVSVHGANDIGSVLAFTLLLKKIERIGDQAKNILDLAQTSSLSGSPESEELRTSRRDISSLFTEAGELLGNSDASDEEVEAFTVRAHTITDDLQHKIDDLMTSERPGSEVVPLAIYHRYVRRIVANLSGVVRTAAEQVLNDDED